MCERESACAGLPWKRLFAFVFFEPLSTGTRTVVVAKHKRSSSSQASKQKAKKIIVERQESFERQAYKHLNKMRTHSSYRETQKKKTVWESEMSDLHVFKHTFFSPPLLPKKKMVWESEMSDLHVFKHTFFPPHYFPPLLINNIFI